MTARTMSPHVLQTALLMCGVSIAGCAGHAVTSVTATPPLTVTDATTTPTIALDLVPPALGGTGLRAPGPAGSFLRSDGTAFTASPLVPLDLPPGSEHYIRNSPSLQSPGTFNIDGKGVAAVFDATKEFDLRGSRILSSSAPTNLSIGFGSGGDDSNLFASGNTFVGVNAGHANTQGALNSFFGSNAGAANDTGNFNAFFGAGAGEKNTTASQNAFFGVEAGAVNTTGDNNAFFGEGAGASNTTSSFNAFFGSAAGLLNGTGAFGQSGNFNAFFGASAGFFNTLGLANSFFGSGAGQHNTTGADNAFFGFGAGRNNTTGSENIFIGVNAGNPNTTTQVSNAIAIGNAATVSANNTIVLGTNSQNTQIPGTLSVRGGAVQVVDSATGGGLVASNLYLRQFTEIASPAHLCWRVSGTGVPALVLTNCTSSSSSLRYKTNVQPFSRGLDVIDRLSPALFAWKASGEQDVGLIAEQVAEVEPLLTYKNGDGEIEGVKYANMAAVFINAIKEQHAQLEEQRRQIQAQHAQLKEHAEHIKALQRLLLKAVADRADREW